MVDKIESVENDDPGREVLGTRILEGKVDSVQDGKARVTMYDERDRTLHAKLELSVLQKAGIGGEGDRLFYCEITSYVDGTASVKLKPLPRSTLQERTQLLEKFQKKYSNLKLPDNSM